MGKTNEARSNKRRFGSGKGASHPTPRRGPPALFVTCESGREKKCQREALELIHHYYYSSRQSSQSKEEKTTPSMKEDDDDDNEALSLEEELAMLRKGAAAEEVLSYEPNSKRSRTAATASSKQISSMKSPFSVYDVGMRGMICILCTLPGSEMVPYDEILATIKAKKDENEKDSSAGDNNKAKDEPKNDGDSINKSTDGKENESVENDANHKATKEVDKRSSDSLETNDPLLWDAVETVRCIMRDAKKAGNSCTNGSTNNNNDQDGKEDSVVEQGEEGGQQTRDSSPPPGSRFILRILPMQTTCYASVEEIKAVSLSLLNRCLPKFQSIVSKTDKAVTFKLEIKRRLCSHLTQDQVIEAVAPMVLGGLEGMPGYKFSVNLSDPDFSIRIETCKSLCGISILPREKWYRNFNLAELTNPSSDKKK